MAGYTVDVATGITAVYGTSAYSFELIDADWSGISREAHETSHQGTAAPGANTFGNRTFTPGDLSDAGEITLRGHHDPDKDVPIDNVAETLTVTWPKASGDASAATWAGSVFVTSVSVSAALDTPMEITIVNKVTGNVTMTDAA